MPQPDAETVHAFFASYLAQDRAAAERLVAEEFVFTSPQDDHIDRVAFFERCFPTADRFKDHQLLAVVPTDGDDVLSSTSTSWKAANDTATPRSSPSGTARSPRARCSSVAGTSRRPRRAGAAGSSAGGRRRWTRSC